MTICRTLALSAATCGFLLGGAAIAAGITVHDARNRDVTIADPARIVSIGGAITEILYALGFEDRLAGVDTTSLYPRRALRDKPNVGYMRQLSAEGVLGLNPSLVLAVQGSGPKETMEMLRERRRCRWCWCPNLFRTGTARQDQAGRPRHGRRQRAPNA